MILKEFKGNSGCRVFLIERNGVLKIKKIASSEKYNSRLKKQIEKQMSFNSYFAKAPKVFGSGITDNKLWYEMEFINGLNFCDFVESKTKTEILHFFSIIIKFIKNNNYIPESIQPDLNMKVKNLKIDKRYDYYKQYVLDYDWSKVKKSYCHGDLTFENIIFANDSIYFIDFLDSFANSKIVDYSKILQDLFFAWSWRNRSNKPFVKILELFNFLKDQIEPEEFLASKRMLCLGILRIVPYTKNTLYLDKCLEVLNEK